MCSRSRAFVITSMVYITAIALVVVVVGADTVLVPVGSTWKYLDDGTDERGRPVPQGIYFFRFHAGGRSLARKAMPAK